MELGCLASRNHRSRRSSRHSVRLGPRRSSCLSRRSPHSCLRPRRKGARAPHRPWRQPLRRRRHRKFHWHHCRRCVASSRKVVALPLARPRRHRGPLPRWVDGVARLQRHSTGWPTLAVPRPPSHLARASAAHALRPQQSQWPRGLQRRCLRRRWVHRCHQQLRGKQPGLHSPQSPPRLPPRWQCPVAAPWLGGPQQQPCLGGQCRQGPQLRIMPPSRPPLPLPPLPFSALPAQAVWRQRHQRTWYGTAQFHRFHFRQHRYRAPRVLHAVQGHGRRRQRGPPLCRHCSSPHRHSGGRQPWQEQLQGNSDPARPP
mmetsp:Transcript_104055/g.269381  ORF Transcript_104055/g.269381 Transcript_104055/m.269381 type:complete len:314 (-) Transcript_104055:1325-2266(-)